jgi:hypothetical protein
MKVVGIKGMSNNINRAGMVCPLCNRKYRAEDNYCRSDGARLEQLDSYAHSYGAQSEQPRLISEGIIDGKKN